MANISSINGNPIVPSNGSVGTAQVASGYNLMSDDEKSKLSGVPAQGNTPFSSINGNPIVVGSDNLLPEVADKIDGSVGIGEQVSLAVFGEATEFPVIWRHGSIGTSGAINASITYRAITGILRVYGSRFSVVGLPSTMNFRVQFFDESRQQVSTTTWFNPSDPIGIGQNSYIRLEVRLNPDDTSATIALDTLAEVKVSNDCALLDRLDELESASDEAAQKLVELSEYDLKYVYGAVRYGENTITPEWRNGAWNDTTGSYLSINTRVVSKKMAVVAGDMIYVTCPEGYAYKMCKWASDGTFNGNGSWYKATQGVAVPQGTGIVSIMFLVSDAYLPVIGSEIDPGTFTGTVGVRSKIDRMEQEIDDLRSAIVSGGGVTAKLHMVVNRYIGDCLIFKFSDGTNLMIDTGQDESVASSGLTASLSELNIHHIDHLVISHWHSDHVGNIPMLYDAGMLDSSTVCYLPQQFTGEDLEGIEWMDQQVSDRVAETYKTMLPKLASCQKVYPTEWQTVTISGAKVQFWNADHTVYLTQIKNRTLTDYNLCSLCCNVTIGMTVVCCTGDAGLPVLDDYADKLWPCNIYKANHHSMGYVADDSFMNAVCPEIVLTSLGTSMYEQLITQSTRTVHTWCEENGVPDFVTGAIGDTIRMELSGGGYRFTSKAHRLVSSK